MVIHTEVYGDRKRWYDLVAKRKQILERTIIWGARFLPEPKIEMTSNPNTKRLIKAWDCFLECDSNPSKRNLWEALRKITCVIYDSEPYYALRGNALLKDLINAGWEFELPPEKQSWWKEGQ